MLKETQLSIASVLCSIFSLTYEQPDDKFDKIRSRMALRTGAYVSMKLKSSIILVPL